MYDCLALGTMPVVLDQKWLNTFPFKVSCLGLAQFLL